MPANLTPEYIEAERRYRAAKSPDEKLACLEEMLAKIPKHKGTEKMQAGLRKRISQYKEQSEAQSRKRKGHSYKIPPEGAGQLVLIGCPNVGKSAILNAMTHAEPEVADYPFTTRTPIPGMMPYLDISIQLVDLPPVSTDHVEPWISDIAKASDGVLLVCDLGDPDPVSQLETGETILNGYGIHLIPPASDPSKEIVGVEKRALIIANKIDLPDAKEMLDLVREMYATELPILPVSAISPAQLETLKKPIFDLLKIIRVYSKQPGKHPDMEQPFTVPRNATLMVFAETVHKDFVENLKYGRVWGSGKFDGQVVKQDHVLEDGDIVELHI